MDLFRLTRAFEYSRAFQIANSIDVFTELHAGALTLTDLATRTKVEAKDLECVLIVNAALGLLLTDGEKWCNSLLADKHLVKGKPEYIGDAVWLTGNWWQRFDELGKSMAEQHGLPTEAERHPRFIEAMNDYASSGEGEEVAELLDLSGRRHLLDLGGGPGTYSSYLCDANPDLRVTVFDLPETEPVFSKTVAARGLTDRITFKAGDLETDDLGSGYDAALVSNMMHGSRGDIIPPKVFRALEPGGIIIIRDFILRTEKDGPLAAAMFNMRMGAYTEDEIYDFLHQAGFRHCEVIEQGDQTIITAHKP